MMKYFIKRFLSISLLVSSTLALASDCGPCSGGVTPTFNFRSQGTDNARKLEGTEGHTHLYDMECWWGMFALFVEYTQSFRSTKLAHCLFGSDLVAGVNGSSSCNSVCNSSSSSCSTNGCNDGNCILIQGSTVTSRNPNAWLADYFYLPTDYNGSICLDPRIRNINIPFDLYLGLDEWICNLYFRAYGTLTHTRWELNPCEAIASTSTAVYPAGYFASTEIANDTLLQSALAFFQGNAITVDGLDISPLSNAKMYCGKRTKTGYANLWLELGWDFINDCDYHFGLGFVVGAPTGGKRDAEFAFNPVVGNGNHWAVGGVVTGHYTFWRSCDEDQYFGFHFDANITHLVKARECRTFDLCGKPNSRYMLMARLDPTVVNNLATLNTGVTPDDSGQEVLANVTLASRQFAGVYTPLANLSTFETDVKIGVQGDVAAKFNFTSCNWSWDLGYNFWGRSCEDIEIDSCDSENSRLDKEFWVPKGNERVYGFVNTDQVEAETGIADNTPVALNPSQSAATIHGGTNIQALDVSQNFGVDTPCPAYASGNGTVFAALMRATGQVFDTANTINTSKTPLKVGTRDLDLVGTRGISHKIFTHINYTWDCECWIPFVGIGGYAEFGKTEGKCCPQTTTSTSSNVNCSTLSSGCGTSSCNSNNNCSKCVDCALSQWAVWIRGGVSWN